MGSVRWSVVAAVVVALASGSGVLAPAARLLPPAVAGAAVSDPCTQAPLDVSYDVALDPGLGAYVVTAVRVHGLPAGCADRELWVTLTSADGATLAEVRTEPAPGPSGEGARVGPLASPVPAAEVAEVAGVLGAGPARG